MSNFITSGVHIAHHKENTMKILNFVDARKLRNLFGPLSWGESYNVLWLDGSYVKITPRRTTTEVIGNVKGIEKLEALYNDKPNPNNWVSKFKVNSFTSTTKIYEVTKCFDGRWHCDCPDYTNRPYHECKHIKSVK